MSPSEDYLIELKSIDSEVKDIGTFKSDDSVGAGMDKLNRLKAAMRKLISAQLRMNARVNGKKKDEEK